MKSTNFRVSRSGAPWPNSTSFGSMAASFLAERRFSSGFGVRAVGGSWRPGTPVHVHAGDHVPEDEDAVGLPPEGDVAGGMPGDVEHLEAGDLVALMELAIDRVAGPMKMWMKKRASRLPGWRWRMSSGSSAAAASRSPTHKGMPSASQTSWLAP